MRTVALTGLLVAGIGTARTHAFTPPQQQTPTSIGAPPSSNSNPGTNPTSILDRGTAEPDPYSSRMKHQQENAALDDRHKHMVADADKLLQMATELKAEVEKSSRNETSITAYNKADAIERLAHDVKQRLKN